MKFLKRYHLKDYKFMLVVLVGVLSCLGIMVIGSAKDSVQNKQIVGLILGLVIMVVISLIDYVWVLNWYWLLYIGNLLLLLSVRFFGENINGAQRWINIGFTQFQPSELAKILLILFFAKFIMIHKEDLSTPKTLITAAILILPSLLLIYKQPDMSTTISIALVFCIIMYIGGLSYRFIGTALAIVVPLSLVFISIAVQPNQTMIKDYQQERILAWLHPQQYEDDVAYQQTNSIMAIGSGQLKGKGLNNNTTTSVKNGNFILEPQTDFIFAIVGEELGFVGCCIVIALLLLLVILCIVTAIKAQDLSGRIICCGVAAQIGFQSFINIGVATALLPNTGIPLPFVSAGLTSLVSMCMGIGFVLNVGLQPKKYQ